MSKPIEEDRFWWLAMALGLLRELDERDNQYITREAAEHDAD